VVLSRTFAELLEAQAKVRTEEVEQELKGIDSYVTSFSLNPQSLSDLMPQPALLHPFDHSDSHSGPIRHAVGGNCVVEDNSALF
jgi:hypothetical protein